MSRYIFVYNNTNDSWLTRLWDGLGILPLENLRKGNTEKRRKKPLYELFEYRICDVVGQFSIAAYSPSHFSKVHGQRETEKCHCECDDFVKLECRSWDHKQSETPRPRK